MAKPLINYQREFLLEYFFKNESCPGWRDIAIKLLNTGQCIVPGKDKLWQGGIGNFIKTSIEPDMIGCLLYKLKKSPRSIGPKATYNKDILFLRFSCHYSY